MLSGSSGPVNSSSSSSSKRVRAFERAVRQIVEWQQTRSIYVAVVVVCCDSARAGECNMTALALALRTIRIRHRQAAAA